MNTSRVKVALGFLFGVAAVAIVAAAPTDVWWGNGDRTRPTRASCR